MSRLLAILAGAALASAAVQPLHAETGAAIQAQPGRAVVLSRLLNPPEKLLDVTERAFEAGFRAALDDQSETAAMLEQHPKLAEAVMAAAQPVLRRHVEAEMPALERKFADFYASRFSPAEIDGLIGFYSSPTGVKLIEGMYAGADFQSMIASVGPDGQDPITTREIGGFVRSTVTRILPAFNEGDRKALTSFARTPLFAKLRRVLPEFQQLMADIANKPTPAMDAEINQAVERAVEDYWARQEAGSAS